MLQRILPRDDKHTLIQANTTKEIILLENELAEYKIPVKACSNPCLIRIRDESRVNKEKTHIFVFLKSPHA